MSKLEILGVCKSYQGTTVLRDVSLEVKSGEFVTLLGPSGCGKTTLLRSIAGLAQIEAGQILIDGSDVSRFPVEQRRIGMVFQAHALFPHMSVLENVAFGLRMRGVALRERHMRAERALETVRLGGLGKRMPHELSGGQQQRVALARVIIIEPRVLLLDEPFGALDRKLREALQVELRRVTRDLGMTAVFVTHDQEEALVLSDRIAVMDAGRFAQIDVPATIFDRPATRFVADFMGVENLINATVETVGRDSILLRAGDLRVRSTVMTDRTHAQGESVVIGIRSQRIRLASGHSPAELNSVTGTVRDAIYRGDAWTLHVDTSLGSLVCAAAAGDWDVTPLSAVTLTWDQSDVCVLAA